MENNNNVKTNKIKAFSFTLSEKMPGYLFEINYSMMLVGLVFSILLGAIFGWLPARKASKMNPIDALK